jgi:lycopene cyclase domain-containing protein
MHFNYVLWLVLFVLAPLGVLWSLYFRYLWQYKRTLWTCILFALLFSVPWDVVAVKANIWNFPKSSVLGIWFLNLPIEELFFMVFVTFLYATTALVVKLKLEERGNKRV